MCAPNQTTKDHKDTHTHTACKNIVIMTGTVRGSDLIQVIKKTLTALLNKLTCSS